MKNFNHFLKQLLEAHDIPVKETGREWLLANDQVYMGCGVDDSLFERQGIVQMDVYIPLAGKRELIESFAGVGTSVESAAVNALENFSTNSLHVLLHTFFGVPDMPVTVEEWTIKEKPWRAIIGDYGTRNFDDHAEQLLPALWEAVKNTIVHVPLPTDDALHWGRIFYAGAEGKALSCEALIDNQPAPTLAQVLQHMPWPQKEEFVSVRRFFIFHEL